MRAWTDEELRNAMTYGLCPICGEPRFTEMEYVDDTAKLSLTCPSGHDMDWWEANSELRGAEDVPSS